MNAWVRVARVGDGRDDAFEEAERMESDLDDTHRLVEVVEDFDNVGEVFIEEKATDAPAWVRVATVDVEKGEETLAADYLAEALDTADNYRVVWVYGEDTGYVEVWDSE